MAGSVAAVHPVRYDVAMLERTDMRHGAWVDYDPAWLDAAAADALFATLRDEVTWEARHIRAGAKEVLQPRLMGWGGALPYAYSGQTLPPRDVHPALEALRTQLSSLTGVVFNHVVLNYYRDGGDHMGMHADDEPQLGRDPTIAAISLGGVRPFVLSPKRNRKHRKRMRLEHGSLLVMGGSLQRRWWHGVPRHADSAARINVTFRWLRSLPGEPVHATRAMADPHRS
jgi:alkylated DNA repair dioxygenase AlkB